MKDKKEKSKGLLSWIFEFAGRKRSYFGGSILLAILGVAASFVPYLVIADIVKELIAGNTDWNYYLGKLLIIAATEHLRRAPELCMEHSAQSICY